MALPTPQTASRTPARLSGSSVRVRRWRTPARPPRPRRTRCPGRRRRSAGRGKPGDPQRAEPSGVVLRGCGRQPRMTGPRATSGRADQGDHAPPRSARRPRRRRATKTGDQQRAEHEDELEQRRSRRRARCCAGRTGRSRGGQVVPGAADGGGQRRVGRAGHALRRGRCTGRASSPERLASSSPISASGWATAVTQQDRGGADPVGEPAGDRAERGTGERVDAARDGGRRVAAGHLLRRAAAAPAGSCRCPSRPMMPATSRTGAPGIRQTPRY